MQLDAVAALCRRAGEAIMRVYASDFAVRTKDDASPCTLADEQAEAILVEGLAKLDPAIPVVAEEAVARHGLPEIGRRFWLVDPLDGTREFIARNGEFTVNVALIEDGRPRLGVVHAPALGRLWAGAVGMGAFEYRGDERREIRVRAVPADGVTVVSSRSHGDAQALERLLAGVPVARTIGAGSSLKLCAVAAGEADLYPRLGRTMEWDIAAGHAVLRAAGGEVRTLDGQPLQYGKPGLENPHFCAMAASITSIQCLTGS